MPLYIEYYYNGWCKGEVKGTGLLINCSLIINTVDLSKLISNGITLFAINFILVEDYTYTPTL